MFEQIGGILIDAVGAGSLQLFFSIAAGQQANAEGAGTSGGEHVPNTITNDDRIAKKTRGRAAVATAVNCPASCAVACGAAGSATPDDANRPIMAAANARVSVARRG